MAGSPETEDWYEAYLQADAEEGLREIQGLEAALRELFADRRSRDGKLVVEYMGYEVHPSPSHVAITTVCRTVHWHSDRTIRDMLEQRDLFLFLPAKTNAGTFRATVDVKGNVVPSEEVPATLELLEAAASVGLSRRGRAMDEFLRAFELGDDASIWPGMVYGTLPMPPT